MANKVEKILCRDKENGDHNMIAFLCPGCDLYHCLPVDGDSSKHPVWGWNGSLESPTLTPSILGRTPGRRREDGSVYVGICHSFVTDGRIQFLSDCTHSLSGQTVDLPDVD